MAEGALRLRDKQTGNIVNYQPGASYDPNQYEKIPSAMEAPMSIAAPQAPSPFVEAIVPTPVAPINVSQTPPAVSSPVPQVGTFPPATPVQPGLTPSGMATSTTTTSGFKVPGEIKNEFTEVDKEQRAAIDASAKLGMLKAAEQEAFAREKQLANEARTQQMQELEGRRTADLTAKQADLQARIKAADAATIDPGRFFAQKGALSEIGAAFAVAMGAYSSAMTGGKNYALDIVNNAIEKDIMAQKEAKASANDAVNRARASWEDARQVYGDEALAKEAIHIQKLTAVANNWESRIAKFGSEEQRIKGMQELAAFRNDIANRNLKFAEMAQNKTQNTATVELKPGIPKSALTKDQFDQAKDLRHEYENNAQRTEGVTELSNADKVNDLYKSARAGNAEAKSALTSLWAKYVNGPGVLTENDFKRAGLTQAFFSRMAAKMSSEVLGEFSDSELAAIPRIEGLFRTSGNRKIAKVAADKMRLAERTGIPIDLVVSSPEERNIAVQGERPSSGKAASVLGLKPVNN